MKHALFIALLLVAAALQAQTAPDDKSVQVVIDTVSHIHPTAGTLTERVIIFYNRHGREITREAYTPDHECYGWNFDSLSTMQEYLIRQRIGN